MINFFIKIKRFFAHICIIVKTKTALLWKKYVYKIQSRELMMELDNNYKALGKTLYNIYKKENICDELCEKEFNDVTYTLTKLENLDQSYRSFEQHCISIVENCEGNDSNIVEGQINCVCNKCHTVYNHAVNFCTKCGNKLT